MKTENLKLIATSSEDLRVIAAHLQDAIVSSTDIAHLKNKILLVQLNRFMGRTSKRVFFVKIKEYEQY